MEEIAGTPQAAMLALMQEERTVIRSGRFEALAALAARKEALVSQLADQPSRDLGRVVDMAQANQRLLAAAIDGVRAARDRLAAIRAAGSSCRGYDCTGKATEIVHAGGSLEHRA